MPKVRNISGQALYVPELNRTVKPNEVVTVPQGRLDGYTCQPKTWKPVHPPTTKNKE